MSLRLESVVKNYPDFRITLSFSVRKGELLTLLGPSGCGKTTSLRLIAGFIEPDSGRILLADRLINHLPPEKREIGIVFQDYALFPNLNVIENIAFGPKMHGWSGEKSLERAESLVKLVHLEGYEKRKVTRLSGGEQQRVALARSLAPDPRLLLLDEPLSALDARLRKSLRREIRRIQQELNITTVYITHDQEEALSLSDRIAVMRDGEIEQIGTPREIYNRPRNLFVAGFIGQANLIRGTIVGERGGYALLETAFGKLEAPWPTKSAPPAAGIGSPDLASQTVSSPREVILFFRPESCRIGNAMANNIRGRVVRSEYLGEYTQLEIEASEVPFILKLKDSALLRNWGRIDFSFNPDDCRLLPDPGNDSF